MATIKNGTDWKYCEKCGQELIYVESQPDGYDRKTGRKKTDFFVFRCPNYRGDEYYAYTHDRIEIHEPVFEELS